MFETDTEFGIARLAFISQLASDLGEGTGIHTCAHTHTQKHIMWESEFLG